ncbi:helix-turn-helix transcriptional regulator [Ligilactobacillus salivarius]|jgi:transcriptional regulator with XRE-family HTH domain|uniref:helix-turn-helix transcriptional regulator n=1 Tax=Ligilactobacillus salivarius TaxID=1624 RepID=UPI00136B1FCD|nr:helix-turn-helix transcriptional regulator [Ligilactobacillus salivarius]UVX35071.1 MAG: helix-turn-helix domain protein [Bacteriophage sp.]DAY67683.1 MAG TPA: helix-turn-helix domain protein [Caudoviricetes sp.]MYU71976.1 helix-turn-helix transcriptional regulator [Ligilactobacillus salivarius]MYY55272.1 helix-turn-helix transcriptional regulator [Ligilactobacillus salivarius]MYZ76490.1 helix-turn-helix transcriptional regulator [Ligilactobacillus salivarius]
MTLLKENANSILKEELESRGLKQKFVAENIGVTTTYLSQLLNGSRNLSVEIAIKTARFLNVPLEKILS